MNTGRTLGIAAPNLSYENVSLTSDINLGESSTVVFQPWDVLKGASKLSSKDVHPIRTRIIALTEWVKLGNDIIVVLSRMDCVVRVMKDERCQRLARSFRQSLE
jgi:hypothetical protein